jgi:hypothetical protein
MRRAIVRNVAARAADAVPKQWKRPPQLAAFYRAAALVGVKLCAMCTCASRVRMLTASPQKQRAMPSARCVGSGSARACILSFQAVQSC